MPMSTMDMFITCCHLPPPEHKHALQIIQLVEGPPPPKLSAPPDSSRASDDDDDDDESSCESYCSSEQGGDVDLCACSTDTYVLRMKRILAWRDNFSVQMSTTLSGEQVWHYFPLSRMTDDV